MIRTVGIDIGTQKTIIVADDGEIVRTSTGSVSFPTLIAFQDKSPRNIGDEATSGDTIIPMINLITGKSIDEIEACEALSLSKISFGASDYASSVNVLVKSGVNEENINVSSLLGFYLCKIWERICQVYGETVNLAIACPNFTPTVCRAYFDACIVAGIDASKVFVVDSSEAIVSAYVRKLSAIRGNERSALDHKLVALLEVGHIQSSVTIVRIEPVGSSSPVMKLSTASDPNLGCIHFDFKLFDHLSKICQSKHSTSISYGSKRGNRLLSGCERLRKLLSQLAEGIVTVENLTDNGDVTFTMKREEFMEISSDLLQRLRSLIRKAWDEAIVSLKSSAMSAETKADTNGEATDEIPSSVDVDSEVKYVEIFGGGLRMPIVQNLLYDVFGQNLVLGAKLDDGSVAIGATLVANRFLDATAVDGAVDNYPIYRNNDESIINAIGLPNEVLADLKAKELAFQAVDRDMRQLLAVRNSLESYILEMRSAPKRKFGELIDATKLNAVLDESEGWVWDHQDASLEEFTVQDKSLRDNVQEICRSFFDAVETDRLQVERKLEEEAAKAAAEKPEDEDEDHDTRKLKKADRMRLVVKNKDEGTELFKGGNYRPAAARYHKSLTHIAKFFDLSPDDEIEVKNLKITLHLNLATCYLKMENMDQMLRNVEDAMALDPNNPKAFFRRAQYYEAKKDWDKAYEDAKKCQNLMDVEDKLVKQTVDRYAKEVAKMKEKEKKMWSKAFS